MCMKSLRLRLCCASSASSSSAMSLPPKLVTSSPKCPTAGSPVTPPLNRSPFPPGRSPVNNAERMELYHSFVSPNCNAPPSQLTPLELDYCRHALKLLSEKTKDRANVDKEFDSLSSDRLLLRELMARTTVARSPVNRYKNRYIDVLPYDYSRVILDVSPNEPEATPYINASYLVDSSHASLPIFIATQGPMKHTISDFWEMVIQQQCSVVVMLTSLVDGNIVKCESYVPLQPQQSQVYGRIKVTKKISKSFNHGISASLLEVQYIQSTDPPLPVLHLQYLDWPDHGVPMSTHPIRELFEMLYRIPSSFGPFLIHCSAGIGRTGVLCTVDHTLRKIFLGNLSAVDIINTVREFRQQRLGMVQTREQYAYCYQAVIDELMDMLSKQEI